MSISITIDNDRVAAGIQNLIEDESPGFQTPGTTDTGNEINVSLTNPVGGLLGGFQTAFNTFLNGISLLGMPALGDAQKVFASTNDGASSSADFVKVTASNGETVSDLFFSDAAGAPLDGDAVFLADGTTHMQTVSGDNIYLWSSGDFCVATTSATAGAGRIVAAFYLNDTDANHLQAQVQMVTFEPLKHPDTGNFDDALNFTNILQVSAAGSQSFDFDALKSSGALWVAVGNNQTAIVVSGYSLDVDAAGKLDGTSNKIAVSQGGTGTTIGLNNQLFDANGERAVFTLVNGLDSLTSADGGILSDYIVDHTGPAAEGLNYTGYINVIGAGIFLSQSQGTPTETKDFDIDLYHAGGAGNVPEVGFNYIGTEPSGAFADDTPVNAATVTIKDDQGNLVATWVAGADPDGAGPLLGSGATIHHVSTASGAPGNNVTVTISGNNIDIGGVLGGYTVSWTSAGGVSFNRFTLKDEGAGKFDVGRVDLIQGVSSHTPVGGNLIVQDDGPSITASAVNAPSITDDESVLTTDNHANYAGNFTAVFGADGAGATPKSYALSTAGGSAGVTDTATGHTVFLFAESGQIVGREGIDAAGAASGQIVFVVSVDQTGEVTLDQRRAVVHANPNDSDESRSLTGVNKVTLTATAFDGDGDHAAAALDITTLLNLKDDGPSITASAVNAPSITDDETVLATNNHANYAGNFTPVFGADGAGATPRSYALSTPGGDSGIIDTATGLHVFLFKVGDNIVGKAGTDSANALAGTTVVFVVSTDQTGEVTLDQQRAIVHPDTGNFDESKSLTGSNLVVLTATAFDGDGDHAAAPLDITGLLNFKDDGPSITASAVNAPSITDDETVLATNNHANYAGNFTPVFGADGAGATPRSYALSTPGGDSGIIDTATGLHVFLFKVGDNIVGKAGTDSANALAGTTVVFVVSTDQTGEVTLDQQRAIIHPDTGNFDESKGLTGSNLVILTATAFDGDGDHAAAPLDITGLLAFKDDGLSIVADSTGAPSITDDETVLATNNHANYAGNFTVTLGADGAGATPRSYSLTTAGGSSGLIDTASTNPVFLFKVGDNIVGKAGTDATAAAGGPTVFVVSIDQTGEVTLDQQRAVVHIANTGPDQSTTLSSAGLVVVNATAFDGDGDHAAATLNIGQLLNFKDDAPTITAQILGGTLNFVDDAFISHTLNGDVKADVITNVGNLSQAGVKQYTITGYTDVGNSVYPNMDGVLSADGTKVTYYSTNVAANQDATTAVYELTLDQTGAGAYTFTILQPPPIVQTNFTFTDLPSGQNLLGVIAQNKANVNNNGTPNNPNDDFLPDGGLLVFPSNPVLDANGQFTNASGTINTSKGGGPVTIGNGNQAFDNAGEGAYFMYVDNPNPLSVGGLGLTATNADDADTIRFNGMNEATRASVTIVQASGAGTDKRPGPAMQIHAYEANPGNEDTDAEARAVVNNPTVALSNQGTAAPEVNIVGVKIHDSTGAVIEYRTLNQTTGAAILQDITGDNQANASDDSAVGIAFNIAKDNAGTVDDIYFTTVSNLKAGYTIEFITATDHNVALVQNVSGSYDIGGFNIFKQSNIPAQDFHFSVQITDYDNDVFGGPSTAFANFDVHVNDLIFP